MFHPKGPAGHLPGRPRFVAPGAPPYRHAARTALVLHGSRRAPRRARAAVEHLRSIEMFRWDALL